MEECKLPQPRNMKTEKIKCPLCSVEFIPRFFHLEKLKYEVAAPVHIVNRFKFKTTNGGFQPPNIVSRSWVTTCPECQYIIKFAAEMGKKEFLEQDSRSFLKLREFKENGKHYEYKFYNVDKPYKEAHDYNEDLLGEVKKRILTTLDESFLPDWGILYKMWKIDVQIDSFKFLLRFLAYIEKYVESLNISIDSDTLIAKVGALYIPYEIKDNVINLIRIRKKSIEEYYELTRTDEELLQTTYIDLTLELLFQEMASLQVNKVSIKIDPHALNKEFYYLELKTVLQNFIENTLYIKEETSYYAITMLNRLKITLG